MGLWALLAEAGLVPGRNVMDGALGRCDIVSAPPEAKPGTMVRASFFSAHRSRSVGYVLAYPPNVTAGAALPHGFRDDGLMSAVHPVKVAQRHRPAPASRRQHFGPRKRCH